jgi:hypothetical protein
MNYPACQFSRSLRDDENENDTAGSTCPWCGAMGKLRCGNLYELVNEVRHGRHGLNVYGIGNGKDHGIVQVCFRSFKDLYGFILI